MVVTDREASLTWMTPWGYSGSILTAVWATEVVAPPMSSGMSNSWRLHLAGDGDHLVEGRGYKAAESDDVGFVFAGGV